MNLDEAIAAQPINLSCTRCGHDFTKLLGDVERDGSVTCPGCGDVAVVDQALRERIAITKQELTKGFTDGGEAIRSFLEGLNRSLKR